MKCIMIVPETGIVIMNLQTNSERISAGIYDVVISVNFMPVISDICNDCSVKYVSWVYDSPLHIRRLDTLKNKCNYIFSLTGHRRIIILQMG